MSTFDETIIARCNLLQQQTRKIQEVRVLLYLLSDHLIKIKWPFLCNCFSSSWENFTHQCRWRAANSEICLAGIALRNEGSFMFNAYGVSGLLFLRSYPKTPVLYSNFLMPTSQQGGNLPILVHVFGMTWLGIEPSPTWPPDHRVRDLPLTHRYGRYTLRIQKKKIAVVFLKMQCTLCTVKVIIYTWGKFTLIAR
jgi:hypothetical protein